jgi:hypothetical protein
MNIHKSRALILQEKGYTILRSQWNHRKGAWKIVKKTRAGWEEFSFPNFESREFCDGAIDNICANSELIITEEMIDSIPMA